MIGRRHLLSGLNVAAATAGIALLLCPDLAITAEFKILSGSKLEVCRAYKASLESVDEGTIEPLSCERPLSPELHEFSRPDLRYIDIERKADLYRDVISYVDSAAWVEERLKERRFNWLNEFERRIDLDGDGVEERVAVYQYGRCKLADRVPSYYYTYLIVLHPDGESVDRQKTRDLLGVPAREYSTMGLFEFKGKPYFDLWAPAERYKDRNILYVFGADRNRRNTVCRLQYLRGMAL